MEGRKLGSKNNESGLNVKLIAKINYEKLQKQFEFDDHIFQHMSFSSLKRLVQGWRIMNQV